MARQVPSIKAGIPLLSVPPPTCPGVAVPRREPHSSTQVSFLRPAALVGDDLGRYPSGSTFQLWRHESGVLNHPVVGHAVEAMPKRRAEKLIYETLGSLGKLDGLLALYEVKPLSSAPGGDFAIWLLDVGTFGIRGKARQVHQH